MNSNTETQDPPITQGQSTEKTPLRVAVIGAGISGLAATYTLSQSKVPLQISLFESASYIGGHAHTVDISLEGHTFGVDTGFLVYNERTYPGLIALFNELGVEVAKSNMGFSVQIPERTASGQKQARLEWAGNNLASVFAQKRNFLRPRFWGMLKDILRFNKLSTALALELEESKWSSPSAKSATTTVGTFLKQHGFGQAFQEDYFLPMVACIWSCPPQQMLEFPIDTMVRFCHNHGLLQINHRPQWFTVKGGSRQYVQKLLATLQAKGIQIHTEHPIVQVLRTQDGVQIHSMGKQEHFDAVIMACHSDQALRMLGANASANEESVLSQIRYQSNTAVLHTDSGLLPQSHNAWAAWNYEADTDPHARVCLHYWLNDLQPLPIKRPVIVSLNPLRQPDPASVIQSFTYEHPIFDSAAIGAQKNIASIQNGPLTSSGDTSSRTWYAGAWQRYGFHEDGYQSGVQAAQSLLATLCGASPNAG